MLIHSRIDLHAACGHDNDRDLLDNTFSLDRHGTTTLSIDFISIRERLLFSSEFHSMSPVLRKYQESFSGQKERPVARTRYRWDTNKFVFM